MEVMLRYLILVIQKVYCLFLLVRSILIFLMVNTIINSHIKLNY